MSNARAARRRGQKNKKGSHNVDVHILFNGSWFDSVDDAQFHIERIAQQATTFPALRSVKLKFQAHHVQKESKEQGEIFSHGEMIDFFFSQSVTEQQKRIIKTSAVSYFEVIVEDARERAALTEQGRWSTQETLSQETRGHSRAIGNDQSSGNSL